MRRGVAALPLLGLVLLPATPAAAAPIGVRTAAPVHVGGAVVRTELSWRYAARGPAPARAEAHEGALFVTALWGTSRRLALGAELRGIARWIEVQRSAAERVGRRAAGLGDPALFARWTVLQRDAGGSFLRLAAIAGAGLPLGTRSLADALGRLPPWQQPSEGAFSPWLEAVLTVQRTSWQLDVALRAMARPGDAAWNPGEELRLDASWQLVVATFEEMTEGIPGFLYLVTEGRAGWRTPHEGELAPYRSGGPFGSALLGAQLAWEGHVLELAARLPLLQPFGKHDTVTVLGAWRFDL